MAAVATTAGPRTGIDDILTYGRGALDDLGFWEIPCAPCARAAELRTGVETGSYWPHTRDWLEQQNLRAVASQETSDPNVSWIFPSGDGSDGNSSRTRRRLPR